MPTMDDEAVIYDHTCSAGILPMHFEESSTDPAGAIVNQTEWSAGRVRSGGILINCDDP